MRSREGKPRLLTIRDENQMTAYDRRQAAEASRLRLATARWFHALGINDLPPPQDCPSCGPGFQTANGWCPRCGYVAD